MRAPQDPHAAHAAASAALAIDRDMPHRRAWPARQPFELAVPASTVWDNLAVSAARHPAKAAVVFLGHTLCYADLLAQASALAGWLHEAGVGPGDRVALFLQNCPQYVIAFHAVVRLRAVVVPVNPMNQTAELQHVLSDAGVAAVVCTADLAPRVAAALASQPPAEAALPVVVCAYADMLPADIAQRRVAPPAAMLGWLLAEHPLPAGFTRWRDAMARLAQPPVYAGEPDDLAILPYTSGTTGLPKGCMHSHKTLMPNIVGIGQWGHTSAESVWLAVAPMFHITGMMGGILTPVFGGGTVVVMPRWERELAASLIAEYRVTEWILVPTMLIDLLGSPNAETFDLRSLRFLNGGGAPLPEAVAEQLLRRLGLTFTEGYGLTETAAPTHSNPVGAVKRQCIGIPFYGTDARIVDPVSGQQLPPGEMGEIVVTGPQLFLGYWKQPAATADAFLQLGGKAFFRTGDLGHVDDDGYFFVTDRLKRMINASGYKVWPSEVELMLFKHPAVHEACVISGRDPYRGETVKAVVVRKSGFDSVSAEDIIAWARGQMSAYKVPRAVEFVDALPKTGSGKVMWRTLQEAGDREPRAPVGA